MPNVLIRDVPEDVQAVLQRRAKAAGQSLQQYLLAELASMTSAPTLPEILETIEAHRNASRVGLAAVQDLEEEREARGRR
ncbi:MAG: hypothetical protein WCL53_07360 [Chloroflexota bacterium]